MALWNNSRPIMYVLGLSFLCLLVASVVITQLFNNSLEYASFANDRGCRVVKSNSLIIICFILLVLLETLIVVLTAIRASYHLQRGSSGWVVRLYRQGFAFYLYMLTMTILNLVWPIVAQAHFKTLFAGPQRALHSIFCSRVFFIILKKQTGPSVQQASSYERHSISGFTRSNNFLFSTIIETMDVHDDDWDDGYDSYTLNDRTNDLGGGRHGGDSSNQLTDEEGEGDARRGRARRRTRSWRRSVQSAVSGKVADYHMVNLSSPAKAERTTRIDSLDGEREDARKEEEKRLRIKFPPVNTGVGLPNELPLEVGPTVLRRLKDVKYVPLYHFTNEGARAATKDVGDLVEDEMYRIMDNSDGIPTFVKGGSKKGLETKIADEDLNWEQFQVATMRFIAALQLAGWPSDRQKMFTEFFYKIQMHPWRTSPDPDGIKDRALFIYAAEQRKLWHQYLELGVNPVPDLAQFNEEALRRAKDEAYDRHRSRRDRAADQRNVPFLLPMNTTMPRSSSPSSLRAATLANPAAATKTPASTTTIPEPVVTPAPAAVAPPKGAEEDEEEDCEEFEVVEGDTDEDLPFCDQLF
ncbi:hypothetical protein NMY22_g12089 [Coprinellus aureogranulatus]|nr:hypothetical protein NMY22_g12089 [Coprinellus aureogranulatus]